MDGDLSAGEAIMQILPSLTMVLPGAISAFKNLKVAQDAILASRKANALAAQEEAVATAESAAAQEASAAATGLSTEAEIADTAATTASTVAETADAAASTAGAAAEGADTVATTADTVAKGANAVATGAATAAQASFNAVLMANPIVLVVAAIAGLIAIFGVLSAASEKAKEARVESAEKAYEEAVATREEAQAKKESADAFLDLYKQYQAGTKSKNDLAKATDSLIKLLDKEDIEIAKLTGNYDNLIEKLKAARKEALQGEIKGFENEKAAAEEKILSKGYKSKPSSSKNGYLYVSGSGNHGLSYDDEFTNKDFSQWLIDQGHYDFVEQDENGNYYTGIRTKENAESMAQLEKY